MVRHEGERQKKAMSKFNHRSPARWVLWPLLSNLKCMYFARWTLRKPCNTIREESLSLITEERLRLLRRALGLWIPAVAAGSPCRSEVDAAPTPVPAGSLPACLPVGHGLWPSMPWQPSYSTQGTVDWNSYLGFMYFSSAPAPNIGGAEHHDAQPLGVLVLKQMEVDNLFTQVRLRGKCTFCHQLKTSKGRAWTPQEPRCPAPRGSCICPNCLPH